uniref:Uncharacterized protein n=1 Tax=Anopheles culicifacies TaxID=139723 RepID=A0A182MHZ7_9DIPT
MMMDEPTADDDDLFLAGLSIICPSTTVMADNLPALVRIVRQQNKLPMEQMDQVVQGPIKHDEPDYDDDVQSAQQVNQQLQFTHQHPVSTSSIKEAKQSVVLPTTQHPVQSGIAPVKARPKTDSNSSSSLVQTANSKPSATPTPISQQKLEAPITPIPIVLNVNVIVEPDHHHHHAETIINMAGAQVGGHVPQRHRLARLRSAFKHSHNGHRALRHMYGY